MVIHWVVYSLCSKRWKPCGWLWDRVRKPDGMGVRKQLLGTAGQREKRKGKTQDTLSSSRKEMRSMGVGTGS